MNHLKEQESEDPLTLLSNSLIGRMSFQTIYGCKPLIYVDYTASGRCLSIIENCMLNEVEPLYANTHTEISQTGCYTTQLREDAREYIKGVCGANNDLDAMIFTGSGATAGLNLLATKLGL